MCQINFLNESTYLKIFNKTQFCRPMLCICTAYAVMRYLSVCLSVTFVDHVKTNKHIYKNFSPSVSHTILYFPYQTRWRYSDGNAPNGENAMLDEYLVSLHTGLQCCQPYEWRSVKNKAATNGGKR